MRISDDHKWVTTGRGPLPIRDRAAPLLKLAGFQISSNGSIGKRWEKSHNGTVHILNVLPDGSWLHLTASEARLLEGLAEFRTEGSGKNHRDLMSYLGSNPLFSSSQTDLEK